MPGPSRQQPKPSDLQPVEDFLRTRRRLRAGSLVGALLLLLVLVALDRWGGGFYAADDVRRYDGQRFRVARVIDGDTIDLRVADGEYPTTRIRLWGVDTPELASRDGSRPAEAWAQEATAFVKDHVQGRSVTLHLEPHRRRGRFGRLLAYVELEDGTLLNARLIEAGLSPADDRWSHSRSAAFLQLEAQAKQQEVGLWSP